MYQRSDVIEEMDFIFEKWNQEVDQEKLKKEVEEAAAGSTNYEDVPIGEYEVSIANGTKYVAKRSINVILII